MNVDGGAVRSRLEEDFPGHAHGEQKRAVFMYTNGQKVQVNVYGQGPPTSGQNPKSSPLNRVASPSSTPPPNRAPQSGPRSPQHRVVRSPATGGDGSVGSPERPATAPHLPPSAGRFSLPPTMVGSPAEGQFIPSAAAAAQQQQADQAERLMGCSAEAFLPKALEQTPQNWVDWAPEQDSGPPTSRSFFAASLESPRTPQDSERGGAGGVGGGSVGQCVSPAASSVQGGRPRLPRLRLEALGRPDLLIPIPSPFRSHSPFAGSDSGDEEEVQAAYEKLQSQFREELALLRHGDDGLPVDRFREFELVERQSERHWRGDKGGVDVGGGQGQDGGEGGDGLWSARQGDGEDRPPSPGFENEDERYSNGDFGDDRGGEYDDFGDDGQEGDGRSEFQPAASVSNTGRSSNTSWAPFRPARSKGSQRPAALPPGPSRKDVEAGGQGRPAQRHHSPPPATGAQQPREHAAIEGPGGEDANDGSFFGAHDNACEKAVKVVVLVAVLPLYILWCVCAAFVRKLRSDLGMAKGVRQPDEEAHQRRTKVRQQYQQEQAQQQQQAQSQQEGLQWTAQQPMVLAMSPPTSQQQQQQQQLQQHQYQQYHHQPQFFLQPQAQYALPAQQLVVVPMGPPAPPVAYQQAQAQSQPQSPSPRSEGGFVPSPRARLSAQRAFPNAQIA